MMIMKPKAEYTETPGNRYDVMTYKTYAFGAAIVLFGGIGVYMMVTKPYMYPLLTVFFYSIPGRKILGGQPDRLLYYSGISG